MSIASVAFGEFLVVIPVICPLRPDRHLQRHLYGHTFLLVRFCQVSAAGSSFC